MSATILADRDIPAIRRALEQLGPVETFDAARLNTPDLDDRLARARALVVRTVTRIDGELLARAPRLRAVATASAGSDHIDVDALADRGLELITAAGCNATAVAEHVTTWVSDWIARKPDLARAPVGIVGFGHTGRRAAARFAALGLELRLCDPPLEASRGRGHIPSVGDPGLDAWARTVKLHALDDLVKHCGVITLHVPLTAGGDHPTVGLIDATRLAARPSLVWLNAARGGVLDDAALLGPEPGPRACLDVFDGEPSPLPSLFQAGSPVARLSPHIAGYSLEAKLRATELVAAGVRVALDIDDPPDRWRPAAELGPPPPVRVVGLDDNITDPRSALASVLGELHDLVAIDERLRAAIRGTAGSQAVRGAFVAQRRGYRLRREFAAHRLRVDTPGLCAKGRAQLDAWLDALGVGLSDTR